MTPRPVLSWVDGTSRAAIVRCAQPLVGIGGKKSVADEHLFVEISNANPNKRGVARQAASRRRRARLRMLELEGPRARGLGCLGA